MKHVQSLLDDSTFIFYQCTVPCKEMQKKTTTRQVWSINKTKHCLYFMII